MFEGLSEKQVKTIFLEDEILTSNKINSKNKQTKSIFHLKSKSNQASVITLVDWQLLPQVSENAILHPILR